MKFFVFLSCAVLAVCNSPAFAGDELKEAIALYKEVRVPALKDLDEKSHCKDLLTSSDLLSDTDALFLEIERYYQKGIDPIKLVQLQFDENNKPRPEYDLWWVSFHNQFPDAQKFFEKVGYTPRRHFAGNATSSPHREITNKVKPWQNYPVSLEKFSKACGDQVPNSLQIELWARWVIAGSELNLNYDYSKLELKKRFQELMFRFHPDRRPDDKKSAEAATAITVAYGILRKNCRD